MQQYMNGKEDVTHTHTHTKMDPEGNILSELHLKVKDKHCMISLKCGI